MTDKELEEVKRKEIEELEQYGADILLMNPPYDKNTHLDFLRTAVSVSDKTISVNPLRWLQDPFHADKRSTLKQYEDVASHIEDVERFKNNNEFDIDIYSDLGIYLLDKNETNFDYDNYWKESKNPNIIAIIKKVCYNKNVKHLSDVIEKNKREGIRVLISGIAGWRGNLPIYKNMSYAINGKIGDEDWTEKKKYMGGAQKLDSGSPIPLSIKFNSEEEATNFYNSYKNLKTLRFICDITVQQQHIQLQVLPFLNSYKHPITDKMLYKLFNFTKDEIKYIEEYNIDKH